MSDEKVVVPVLKPRDPIAKDLGTPKYRQRVESPKKGKGSFKRTTKLDKAFESDDENRPSR